MLWRDPTVRASLAMSFDHLGKSPRRFLFEIRPDIFPEGYLTETEIELWGIYLESLPKK